MRRFLMLGAVVVVALACTRTEDKPAAEPWYYASDVAKLSTTGRPQLVEFFHPN